MGRRIALDNPDTGRTDNGNQLGWDNDKNGTRRNIVWDDDNRIQSVFDNGHEKTYKYDDHGERVIKRGPQGETAYINQWYTVRNREIASKHVWAGTTRIATSLVPGVKTGSFAPGNGAGNGKGHANGQANAGTGSGGTASTGESKLPSTAQQAPGILKGSGLAHRSAQAAANSRNLEKNPHYATSGDGTGGDTSAPGTANNQDNFLYYYHPDHLCSSSYVTDAYGKVFQHLEYFPFGETWVEEASNTQRTPYLFTAKELDEETGLYYFGARYYDPRVGVWQSADPILAKYLQGPKAGLTNSKNLNLYSYAHLNPAVVLDPDGRQALPIGAAGTGMAGVNGGFAAGGASSVRQGAGGYAQTDMPSNLGGFQSPSLADQRRLAGAIEDSLGGFISGVENVGQNILTYPGKLLNGLSNLIFNVSWTPHGYKHFAPGNVPWRDTVKGTQSGPAKYRPGTDVEQLEREVWANGSPATNGRPWKVKEFEDSVGASEGRESRWVRVEESGGTIHGHPISEGEYKQLTKPKGE